MNQAGKRNIKTSLGESHRKNREKGVYGYMGWSALKIVLLYFLTLAPLILIIKKLFNFDLVLSGITGSLTDFWVVTIFFLSESFLGMIPPDLFTIWSIKFQSPFLVLLLLGIISYMGGVISYFIGKLLTRNKRLNTFVERRLSRYIELVRKWGGAFIIIAALFPYSPYSMVIIAVSLFRFPFKEFLLFGLVRVLRFIILGLFYIKLMNFDTIIY